MRSQRLKRMCTGEEAQPSSQPFLLAPQGSPAAFAVFPSPCCDTSLKGAKLGLPLHPCWEHPEGTALCQWLGAASPSLPWSELCLSLCPRVLGSQLATLCTLHPALVVELSTEILEFSGAVSNIQSKEPIFTHMVSRPACCCHGLLTFPLLLSGSIS